MNVIPLIASAGITGFESPAAEYHQLPLSLDELLVEHPSATFIGRAYGRSMENVGIFDGDILIVDRHVQVQNMDVVVANLNGEFVCKLLDMKQRRLISAAPGYHPVWISSVDQFSVEGVVVRSIRCHRPSSLLMEG
ncbi:LexA family protein [Photobacterium galatheae]|uniref:DNA polymerase V n=1 Tax=Photobacterium galatheae TaxID=1654360 RepID=A0A066RZR1_9GAMM|nr:translesion error-prone DNA polymerase V autoproteolytic subunit [Photobacterium galatheae]KDM92878.1 DNA polymerase V [Photobacterium galatheae]MCM0148157.1 translesion error-prone DNA polymerase V autoproteolytic subunit [Photobacterium galatheae]